MQLFDKNYTPKDNKDNEKEKVSRLNTYEKYDEPIYNTLQTETETSETKNESFEVNESSEIRILKKELENEFGFALYDKIYDYLNNNLHDGLINFETEKYQSLKILNEIFSCDESVGEKIVNRIPDVFAIVLNDRMNY